MSEESNLISQFETAAIEYRSAIAAGDVKAVNTNAKQMSLVFQRLLSSPSGRHRFLSLVNHSEISVRLMASAYGLGIDERLCERILNEMAVNGPYQFEAQQCLDRWRNGEWALDSPVHEPPSDSNALATCDFPEPFSLGLSTLRCVPLNAIVGANELDARIGCINVHFANIIGVNDAGIEFCPNSDPPSNEEILAWIWAIRPDMAEGILKRLADHPLADGIRKLN